MRHITTRVRTRTNLQISTLVTIARIASRGKAWPQVPHSCSAGATRRTTTKSGSCAWRWMNFCGGFSCTYYQPDSCVSGTSDTWRTDDARRYCRLLSRSSPHTPQPNRSPPCQRQPFRDHFGPARSAAARWQLRKDSRPPKRECALLHRQGNHYGLLFAISNCISAGAQALDPRASSPKSTAGDLLATRTPIRKNLSF